MRVSLAINMAQRREKAGMRKARQPQSTMLKRTTLSRESAFPPLEQAAAPGKAASSLNIPWHGSATRQQRIKAIPEHSMGNEGDTTHGDTAPITEWVQVRQSRMTRREVP